MQSLNSLPNDHPLPTYLPPQNSMHSSLPYANDISNGYEVLKASQCICIAFKNKIVVKFYRTCNFGLL